MPCHILTSPIVPVELNLLRNVDANNPESSTTVKSSSLLSGFRGGSSYNHETETIFALPRMQLDFKSIHVQEPQEPSLQGALKHNLVFSWSKTISHKLGVKGKGTVLIKGFNLRIAADLQEEITFFNKV